MKKHLRLLAAVPVAIALGSLVVGAPEAGAAEKNVKVLQIEASSFPDLSLVVSVGVPQGQTVKPLSLGDFDYVEGSMSGRVMSATSLGSLVQMSSETPALSLAFLCNSYSETMMDRAKVGIDAKVIAGIRSTRAAIARWMTQRAKYRAGVEVAVIDATGQDTRGAVFLPYRNAADRLGFVAAEGVRRPIWDAIPDALRALEGRRAVSVAALVVVVQGEDLRTPRLDRSVRDSWIRTAREQAIPISFLVVGSDDRTREGIERDLLAVATASGGHLGFALAQGQEDVDIRNEMSSIDEHLTNTHLATAYRLKVRSLDFDPEHRERNPSVAARVVYGGEIGEAVRLTGAGAYSVSPHAVERGARSRRDVFDASMGVLTGRGDLTDLGSLCQHLKAQRESVPGLVDVFDDYLVEKTAALRQSGKHREADLLTPFIIDPQKDKARSRQIALGQARAHRQNHQYEAALDALAVHLQRFPDDTVAREDELLTWREYAGSLLARNPPEYVEALAKLSAASEIRAEDPEVQRLVGVATSGLVEQSRGGGGGRAAIERLEAFLATTSEAFRDQVRIGASDLYLNQCRWAARGPSPNGEEARWASDHIEPYLSRIGVSRPDFVLEFWRLRVATLLLLGDADKARQAAEEQLAQGRGLQDDSDLEFIDYLLSMAARAARAGRPEEGQGYLDTALLLTDRIVEAEPILDKKVSFFERIMTTASDLELWDTAWTAFYWLDRMGRLQWSKDLVERVVRIGVGNMALDEALDIVKARYHEQQVDVDIWPQVLATAKLRAYELVGRMLARAVSEADIRTPPGRRAVVRGMDQLLALNDLTGILFSAEDGEMLMDRGEGIPSSYSPPPWSARNRPSVQWEGAGDLERLKMIFPLRRLFEPSPAPNRIRIVLQVNLSLMRDQERAYKMAREAFEGPQHDWNALMVFQETVYRQIVRRMTVGLGYMIGGSPEIETDPERAFAPFWEELAVENPWSRGARRSRIAYAIVALPGREPVVFPRDREKELMPIAVDPQANGASLFGWSKREMPSGGPVEEIVAAIYRGERERVGVVRLGVRVPAE